MMRAETGVRAEATRYPAALGGELAGRGLTSDLVTSGCAPRLRLKPPGTCNDDIFDGTGALSDLFDDNVVAAQVGGEWMYLWPWAEPVGPADDPASAAESVLAALCMDIPECSHGAAS
jgi:hypothetical protein